MHLNSQPPGAGTATGQIMSPWCHPGKLVLGRRHGFISSCSSYASRVLPRRSSSGSRRWTPQPIDVGVIHLASLYQVIEVIHAGLGVQTGRDLRICKAELLVAIQSFDDWPTTVGLDPEEWMERYDLEDSLMTFFRNEENYCSLRGRLNLKFTGNFLSITIYSTV